MQFKILPITICLLLSGCSSHGYVTPEQAFKLVASVAPYIERNEKRLDTQEGVINQHASAITAHAEIIKSQQSRIAMLELKLAVSESTGNSKGNSLKSSK